jgi:hypothetical protein
MFDIYSSTEIVVLVLDTLISFACFASALTGCGACVNNGRYYTDDADEEDQLYKAIEEGGGDIDKLSEPLLSDEDREQSKNAFAESQGNNIAGGSSSSQRHHTPSSSTMRVRRQNQRRDYRSSERRNMPGSQSSARRNRAGMNSDDSNSDFAPSNSDFFTEAGETSDQYHRGNEQLGITQYQEQDAESSATEQSATDNELE